MNKQSCPAKRHFIDAYKFSCDSVQNVSKKKKKNDLNQTKLCDEDTPMSIVT